MASIGKFVRWATVAGQPIMVAQVTVTPLAQSLTIRWPQGGFVWNRPVALLLQQDGQTQRVPIVDVTRSSQMVLLGIGVLFVITLWISHYKKEHHEQYNQRANK